MISVKFFTRICLLRSNKPLFRPFSRIFQILAFSQTFRNEELKLFRGLIAKKNPLNLEEMKTKMIPNFQRIYIFCSSICELRRFVYIFGKLNKSYNPVVHHTKYELSTGFHEILMFIVPMQKVLREHS